MFRIKFSEPQEFSISMPKVKDLISVTHGVQMVILKTFDKYVEVFFNFINHLYQVSSPWSPNPIVNGGDLWISTWISSYERIFLWSSYYLKYLLVFDLFVTFYIFIDYKYKINKNWEREREREREREVQ